MKHPDWKPYVIAAVSVIGLILFVLYFDSICRSIARLLKICFPFFLGLAIAFVLNRPFELFRSVFCGRWGMNPKAAKATAVAAVYLLSFGAAALLLRLIVPQLLCNLQLFSQNAGQYAAEIEGFLLDASARLGVRGLDFSAITEYAMESLGSLSGRLNAMLPQLMDITIGFIAGAANFFIGLALSVYLLSGKDSLLLQVKRIVHAYMSGRAQHAACRLAHIVIQVFDDYVAGQCKEAAILGLLCFAGMSALGLSYAALISVVIAVTALLPVVGAYIGGAIAILLLLFVSPRQAAVFFVFLLILQQVEGNIIYPKVVGRKIGLPGIWVLLGVCVGGGLAGILGVLLAVPVTTILYQLLRQDLQKREKRQEPSS